MDDWAQSTYCFWGDAEGKKGENQHQYDSNSCHSMQSCSNSEFHGTIWWVFVSHLTYCLLFFTFIFWIILTLPLLGKLFSLYSCQLTCNKSKKNELRMIEYQKVFIILYYNNKLIWDSLPLLTTNLFKKEPNTITLLFW